MSRRGGSHDASVVRHHYRSCRVLYDRRFFFVEEGSRAIATRRRIASARGGRSGCMTADGSARLSICRNGSESRENAGIVKRTSLRLPTSVSARTGASCWGTCERMATAGNGAGRAFMATVRRCLDSSRRERCGRTVRHTLSLLGQSQRGCAFATDATTGAALTRSTCFSAPRRKTPPTRCGRVVKTTPKTMLDQSLRRRRCEKSEQRRQGAAGDWPASTGSVRQQLCTSDEGRTGNIFPEGPKGPFSFGGL